MPWHDDIIQPKGQGMKKRVTDGKSAHWAQLCWSPWRGSGDLRGWIPPRGPWNSAWLSLRGHTGPSQCPMCPPSWSLPCHAATELLGFHQAAPSPPSCPPQQPPHTQLPHEGFLPKRVETRSVCPGVARLLFAWSCSPLAAGDRAGVYLKASSSYPAWE